MTEAFASFLSDKAMNGQNSICNQQRKANAYKQEMSSSRHALMKKFGNASEVKDHFDAIVHAKSHAFVQQLEKILGQENFKYAVRTLFHKYKNGTVNSDKFQLVIQ